MNIQALRYQAYQDYETLCLCTGSYCGAAYSWELPAPMRERLCYQNKAFKDAIRQQFGDLRRKATWRNAAIHYTALCAAKSTLEPYQLVCFIALPEQISNPIRDAFGPEVIEKILSYPEVAARIRIGLEQLFRELPNVAREFVQTYEGAIAPTPGWPIAA